MDDNGSVKIEKGIARNRRHSGRRGIYPYLDMEIGDSFLVPTDLKPSTRYGIAREGNTRAIEAQKPHRFSVGKDVENRYRIWRVE